MNLLRAFGTVSGFTLLSRVTGLARDFLTATLFGANAFTDAFFVAFRIPNLLRRIFAEGAFAQAFVPTLSRSKAAGDTEKTKGFISAVGSALIWSLLLITVLGVVFAPWIVNVIGGGLAKTPEAMSAATVMTRWMFPYILFISLVAFASGILNTWGRFALPAFTPVILNLCLIGCAVFLRETFDLPVYALAAGVVIGGIAQLALLVPALIKIGFIPKFNFNPIAPFRDPEVRSILFLMAPVLLSVSVAQISLIINTRIASSLTAGSVSWITFADRLMEFPTALLGVALAVVLTPSLSAAHQRNDQVEYNNLLDWGLRICVVLALPAMVGLGLLSEPLTALLFHYGQFTTADVKATSQAVAAYGLGILGLVAIKILAPGFFARQDTKTPVRIAIAVLIFTQILNLILVPSLQHVALALSISLGAWLNAGWMLVALLRRGVYQPAWGWTSFLLTVAASAATMAFFLSLLFNRVPWLEISGLWRVFLVLAVVVSGALIYLGMLLLLGLDIGKMLRKRTRVTSSPESSSSTEKVSE